MNKKISIIVVLFLWLFLPIKVSALSGNIWASASSTTIAPGESVEVTFGYNSSDKAGVQLNVGISGPGKLSGGVIAFNNGGFGLSGSETVTVTATQEGVIRVSSSVEVFESINDESITPAGASVVINVKKPQAESTQPISSSAPQTNVSVAPPRQTLREAKDEKSSNAYLSELSVENAELKPIFNSEIFEYDIELKEGTTQASIKAVAEHAKATLSGSGAIDVKEGINEHNIVVTAEDGSSKTYKLKLNVIEKPKLEIDYFGKKQGVLAIFPSQLPQGYTESEITLNNIKIKALKNEVLNTTLIYTRNEKNEYKWMYVVNNEFSVYEEFNINNKKYVLGFVNEKQTKLGMHYKTITVLGKEIVVLAYDDTALKDFVVMPLYNEKNELKLYQFDLVNETLQLFVDNTKTLQKYNDQLQEEITVLKNHRLFLVIFTVIFSLISVSGIIYILINKFKIKNK